MASYFHYFTSITPPPETVTISDYFHNLLYVTPLPKRGIVAIGGRLSEKVPKHVKMDVPIGTVDDSMRPGTFRGRSRRL